MSKPVPLYQLRLEDLLAPSCCSLCTSYFGTQKQILRHLEKREDKEFLKAAQGYFNGTGDGVARMHFWLEQIVQPVERLGWRPFQIDGLTAEHPGRMDDPPLRFHARRAEGKLHYLRQADGTYVRALQAAFTDLRLEGDDKLTPERMVNRYPYLTEGYPAMLYYRNGKLKSHFPILEKVFHSQEEALADMAQPAEPYFSSFFLEFVR